VAHTAEQFEWGSVARAEELRRAWRLPRCPFAMWAFDWSNGRILAANDAAVKLYGYPRQQLLGATIDDLCRSALGSLLDLDLTSSPQTEAVWHRRRDRSTFQTEVSMIESNGAGVTARMVLVHPLILSAEGDVKLTSALPPIEGADGERTPGPFPSLAHIRAQLHVGGRGIRSA
jgi:PAS domain S-box-containing protein